MTLYEIAEAIAKCVKINEDQAVDTETGEIIDIEALESLEMERDQKIENIACWIKNLNSDAEQIRQEELKLAARRKACTNKADSLKNYLQMFLDGQKWKSPKVAISYRKSEVVDCQNLELVPEIYLKFKDPELDKVGIKKAIKAGEEIAGCSLVEKQSMVLK